MRQRCPLLLPREPEVPPVGQVFLSDQLPLSPHLPLLIPVLQDSRYTPDQTPQVKKNCRPLRTPLPLPRSQQKNLPAGLKQLVRNTNLSGHFWWVWVLIFLILHSCECKEDDAFGDSEGIQDGSAESQEAGGSGTSPPLLEDQQSMYKQRGFIVPYANLFRWAFNTPRVCWRLVNKVGFRSGRVCFGSSGRNVPNAPIRGNITDGCWARCGSFSSISPSKSWNFKACLTHSRETRGGIGVF